MKLYNTKVKKIEDFVSISEKINSDDKKVKMYTCGPTVYDHAHIGNLRAFTFADLLKKALQFEGYQVKHVMNVTDFGHLVGDSDDGEDKMSVGLKREGLERSLAGMKTLASKYTNLFLEDIKKINIDLPDVMPFASEHIDSYIEMIDTLLSKGFAYQISDGIYFDTQKDLNYGKMANLENIKSENQENRVNINTEKKNNRDFALWKFAQQFVDANTNIGFDSPLGFGFPGWHIECSGMSKKFLGETFDIHTGGVDHIAVHHTNEIAQSENANGVTYANFFCHSEFLNINNAVMSKSKHNYFTLESIINESINPLTYRYFLLQSHYRQNINFTLDALLASATALSRLNNIILNLKSEINLNNNINDDKNKISKIYMSKFKNAICDDLNIPSALSTLWEMLKDVELSKVEKYFTALEFDKVFSLDLDKATNNQIEVTKEMQDLIEKRSEYRKAKNWLESDNIRDILQNLGYKVEDK